MDDPITIAARHLASLQQPDALAYCQQVMSDNDAAVVALALSYAWNDGFADGVKRGAEAGYTAGRKHEQGG